MSRMVYAELRVSVAILSSPPLPLLALFCVFVESIPPVVSVRTTNSIHKPLESLENFCCYLALSLDMSVCLCLCLCVSVCVCHFFSLSLSLSFTHPHPTKPALVCSWFVFML